jgi:hypothetical protein
MLQKGLNLKIKIFQNGFLTVSDTARFSVVPKINKFLVFVYLRLTRGGVAALFSTIFAEKTATGE